MAEKQVNTDRTFRIIVLLAVLLVLVVGAWWFWSNQRSRTAATTPRESVSPPAPAQTEAVEPSPPAGPADEAPAPADAETPAPEETIVRYDDTDEEFKKLMSRRKSKFGLKESVDMIVESDETVAVGGISVPMEEILEKIRLKKGEMIETDLMPTLATVSEGERIDRLYTQLKEKERRFKELEAEIAAAAPDDPATADKIAEYKRLTDVMDDYRGYRKALTAIRDWETVLESRQLRDRLSSDVTALTQQKEALERQLSDELGLTAGTEGFEAALHQALEASRSRMKEIDEALKSSAPDSAQEAALVRERAALADNVRKLETYETTAARLERSRALMEQADNEAATDIKAELEVLRAQADALENALADRLLPDKKTDAYGIYIVRPGDNIWNIHFQFLKENFSYRGITLSAVADEPEKSGRSSGVGKILKFSEGMVYIYNLKERRLADDINIIHPLSKIIVFNMARAIELIREIDYEDIKHIQYDGETLWLPSD